MTPEELQIAAAKQLRVTRPVEEVVALVRSLLDFRAATRAKRAKAVGAIGIAIVVALAGVVMITWTPGLVLAIAGFAGMMAGIVIFIRLKPDDLSENFGAAAVPFLAILREEMNARDPLHVEIDLRSTMIAEKMSESEPYKNGVYHEIIDRLYVDPWFEGAATLADGTKVRWKVIEHLLQQTKTKRGTRGRIKTKTKSKRKTVAVVTLAFPMKEYAVSGDAERDEKRATVTLARKSRSDGPQTPAFGMLVDLIAEGYSRVKVSA